MTEASFIEDMCFLSIMDKEASKDVGNSWVASLPFRAPWSGPPNNHTQALDRLNFLQDAFKKKIKLN